MSILSVFTEAELKAELLRRKLEMQGKWPKKLRAEVIVSLDNAEDDKAGYFGTKRCGFKDDSEEMKTLLSTGLVIKLTYEVLPDGSAKLTHLGHSPV